MQNYGIQVKQKLNIGSNDNLPNLYLSSFSIYSYQGDM